MKGLLVKDFRLLSSVGRLYFIFISVMLVLSFFTYTGFMAAYAVIFISVLAPNTVAYDERDRWEKFALTLPITKAQYASSKYLLSLILSLSVVIIATISSLIKNGFGTAVFAYFTTVFAVSLVYPAISLPIVLRFGYSKGKLPLVIFAALLGGSGVILARADYGNIYIAKEDNYIYLILFLAVAILFSVSWFVAVKLYKNKDI